MKELIKNKFIPIQLSLIVFILSTFGSIAQTSPSPQTLPYVQNFGTTSFNTSPIGSISWIATNSPIGTQSNAQSSIPGGDAAVTSATTVQTTGGTYGYSANSNGKLYIQTSSNGTNGTNQFAVSIVTTNLGSIVVSYDIEMMSVQARTVGVVLQYRIGTTGSWINVSGGVYSHNNTDRTNGTVDSFSNLALPCEVNNQPVVEIRWATWRGNEAGNSSGIAIDNISINGASLQSGNQGNFTASKIDVSEGIKVGTASLFLGNFTGTGNDNSIFTDNGSLFLQSNSSYNYNTIINANNTGKVGIGTINPQVNFHVNGLTDFANNPPENSVVLRLQDSSINNQNSQNNRNSWWDFISSAANRKLLFSSGNINDTRDVMTLLENGNVGIGTTTPDYNLEISHHDSTGGITLTNTTNTSYSSKLTFKSISTEKWWLGIDQDANKSNSFFIGGGTNGASKLHINENGQVGIGTTNPMQKLTVHHNDTAGGILINQQDSDSHLKPSEIKFSHNGMQKWAIGSHISKISGDPHSFFIWNNIAQKTSFFISDSGKVGLGHNENPTATLDVNGDIRSSILAGAGTKLVTANSNGVLGTTDFNPSDFNSLNYWQSVNDTDIYHLAGKVAIGTTIQASTDTLYKLLVAGGIKARDIKVKANIWADYVFAKDYKLMPLSELEKFITANNHLPNIPTAKEVLDNGVELGSMQQKLLEKVEEQTLYIISLQKQIDELRSALSNKK